MTVIHTNPQKRESPFLSIPVTLSKAKPEQIVEIGLSANLSEGTHLFKILFGGKIAGGTFVRVVRS